MLKTSSLNNIASSDRSKTQDFPDLINFQELPRPGILFFTFKDFPGFPDRGNPDSYSDYVFTNCHYFETDEFESEM